jgi:hypothetical protein
MPDDYIKRSDALKAILGVSIYDTIEELEGARTIAENTWADGLWDAYKIIEEEVDAADVEPKREIVPWKVAGAFDDFHQCTKCGNMWPIFSTVEWAYCPVCGCRKIPEPLKEEDNAEVH